MANGKQQGPGADIRPGSIDSHNVLSIRHIGPYNQVDPTWHKLIAMASAEGISLSSAQMIGIVYDNPAVTPPERIRYDACISVPDTHVKQLQASVAQKSPSDARLQTIHGGSAVVKVHQGDYKDLIHAYTDAFQHFAFESRADMLPAAAPPYYEFYKNHPSVTPSAELITEIHFPTRAQTAPSR
jgi:AraC family transcriptional regulator